MAKSLSTKGPIFVGVAGIPGSGKSSFTKSIAYELEMLHNIKTLVIPMDGFHYYRKELDKFDDPEEAHARRGAAFTFDSQYFVDTITKAKEIGHGVFPDFDHAEGDPVEGEITFDAE